MAELTEEDLALLEGALHAPCAISEIRQGRRALALLTPHAVEGETAEMTMRRLLEERALMRRRRWSDIDDRATCVYCGNREDLMYLRFTTDFPLLWKCADRKTCRARMEASNA